MQLDGLAEGTPAAGGGGAVGRSGAEVESCGRLTTPTFAPSPTSSGELGDCIAGVMNPVSLE
jgi:hypothetical protein